MSDFRIFGLKSTGDDVLINVEHISEVQATWYGEDGAFEATLHMSNGRKIDCCNCWDVVAARLLHGDDAAEVQEAVAEHVKEAARAAEDMTRR